MSSKGSETVGSDIQIQSALSKMPKKKLPNSPLQEKLDKKLPTKIMIQQALIDLKNRKGVSLHAIKKYIAERYSIDTEKQNHHIKKYIKFAVEEGIITQTKGTGATGSFKLAPIKEKKPKTKKPKKETTKEEKTEKMKDPEKEKKLKEKFKKTEGKSLKSKVKSKESKEDKPVKPKKKTEAEKKPKEKKNDGEKTKKVKVAKEMQPPSKKKAMMIKIKRKSIGSIIKPPKMKPKAQA